MTLPLRAHGGQGLRRFVISLLALAIALLGGRPAVAHAQPLSPVPASVREQLAPQGTLRMAMTDTNFFVVKDATTGELRGVAIDLGRALARTLGVGFEPLLYRSRDFPQLLEGAVTGDWDVAIMGLDATRRTQVLYTAPVMEIDITLVVGPSSRIGALADMDRLGHRIAVPGSTIADLTLSRVVKRAEIVRGLAPGQLRQALEAGEIDGYAGVRPTLADLLSAIPGARILEGSFELARPALALPSGREAGLAFVRDFVESAKRTGLIASAIRRAGLAARVAPPADEGRRTAIGVREAE